MQYENFQIFQDEAGWEAKTASYKLQAAPKTEAPILAYQLSLNKMALNGIFCTDVPLRNYSLTEQESELVLGTEHCLREAVKIRNKPHKIC